MCNNYIWLAPLAPVWAYATSLNNQNSGIAMKKQIIELPEKKLIGISLRTNNKTEIDPITGKIFGCVQRYFHEGLFNKIPHRKNPGVTLCAFANYESDYTGDYDYFIGEEVTSLDGCPLDLVAHVIPAQTYVKFTNGPAP